MPTPCILPALQVTESSVAVGVLAVLGGVLIHLAHSCQTTLVLTLVLTLTLTPTLTLSLALSLRTG